MEIEFGKMCMYSVALASVDMLILHGLEGLVVEPMDPGGSWIQSVDCIFSNYIFCGFCNNIFDSNSKVKNIVHSNEQKRVHKATIISSSFAIKLVRF